jgi:hypothetical protein
MTRLLPLLLLAFALGCEDSAGDPIAPVQNGPAATVDADGDGFYADEECNDAAWMINPGETEICDGVDNNCDGLIDEDVTTTFFADRDQDGAGDFDQQVEACSRPAGYVTTGNDCDDTSADTSPHAIEICDRFDNDCDGEVDEGCAEGPPMGEGDDGDTGGWDDTGA